MVATKATIVVIDHENPTGVPGGASTGFIAQVRLRLVGHGDILSNWEDPSTKIGYRTDVHVIKNRGSLTQVIPFRFLYRPNPIDPASDMWNFLKNQEIATQSGAWWGLKPYLDKQFHEKDFQKELYQQNLSLWPKVISDFYKDRFKQYCELRKIDPFKYLEDFRKAEDTEKSKLFNNQADQEIAKMESELLKLTPEAENTLNGGVAS